ncbi:hypothetical protein ACJJTC_001081 [Scirpophaga incertulas]
MKVLWWLAAASAWSCVRALNETEQCELWGPLLEEWAVGEQEPVLTRQGRVMALPPTKGYYVSERIDATLMPPPPHRPFSGSYGFQASHGLPGPHPGGSYGPQAHTQLKPQSRPYETSSPVGYSQYDEWQETPPTPPSAGKIVNRPPNPYKDKFKPSYPPSQNPAIPVSADRVDQGPPQKQVSETDLYLLTAIEKLVYRADLMEKRLRRMEESVHLLLAGKDNKPEACAAGWVRVGSACYQYSGEAADWKAANTRCRKLRSHLVELPEPAQRARLHSALLADATLRGKDFWTSGLNPGLLWIWSHSAKPVLDNATLANGSNPTIPGEGRCLALVHEPARATYVFRGLDCALRHRYVCQMDEDRDKLSNEIERVAKQLRNVTATARKAKILWTNRR